MELLKKLGIFIRSKTFMKTAGLIALIYIVVVATTMVYLKTYTHHGEKIQVPNLVGQNINGISSLMEEKGLKYEIIDQVYDPKLVEGTIVKQSPAPSEKSNVYVKKNRIIRVRVSKRTHLVEMPDLIDKSERFAVTVLKNRGLRLKITYENTSESHGAVLNQLYKGARISGGTKLPIGSTISLVVGRYEGGVPVPVIDLYGLTISEARERLASLPGITFFPICQGCVTSADTLRARIASQVPEYGEEVMMPSVGTVSVTAVLNELPERPEKNQSE